MAWNCCRIAGSGEFVEFDVEKGEVEVKNARVATSSQESVYCVCFMCISCVPRSLIHVYQLHSRISVSYVSVASQVVRFMCISCVPRSLFHTYQLRPKLSASCVSVVFQGLCFICISCVQGICFMCISCVPRSLLHVYQLCPKVSASCVSVAFQGLCFMCISCVPRSLLHVYQLYPKVSASCVSVAFQGLCFMCISCVPRSLFHTYQLRPKFSAPCVSYRDGVKRFLTFAPPQQSGKQTRRATRNTPHTKYRNTVRRWASALNGYMEGDPQVRERYHPCPSPTTMTRQQCSRRTSKRGTLLPEPFVLSSAARYTTITSGNLP